MSSMKNEDLLSDVEPLPGSAPASPTHSAKDSLVTQSQSNWPFPSSSHCPTPLAHSWPSSPLPALASSSQVTARLYTSLQRSRQLELKGLSASGSMLENLDRPRYAWPLSLTVFNTHTFETVFTRWQSGIVNIGSAFSTRQVTFNLSSPDLRSERVTSLHQSPALPLSFSRQLEECKEAPSGSAASASACLSFSVGDPALGRPMEGDEGGRGLELGQLAEDMSYNLRSRVDNTCATVPVSVFHTIAVSLRNALQLN